MSGATLTPGPSPSGRGGKDVLPDGFQHRFRSFEDLIILETQDSEALGFEVGVSFDVELFPFGGLMHVSVALHDELCFVAVEVADVIAELMLAAELRIGELPVTQ